MVTGHISGSICKTVSRKKIMDHEGSDLVNVLIIMVSNFEKMVARWSICGHWA